MARLPSRDDLGAPPSGRSGRAIAHIDTTAYGEGVARLGKSISGMAGDFSAMGAEANKADEFDAERRFQEFKWNEQRDLEKAMQNVDQEQAGSFADQWSEGYKERGKEFFATVPEPLKRKYDSKLFEVQRKYYDSASGYAKEQQRQFSLGRLEEYQGEHLNRAREGRDLSSLRQDYQGILESNPHFTPLEKQKMARDGMSAIETAHLEGRVARGEDMASIMRDLAGGEPAPPLDEKTNPETRAKPFSRTASSDAAKAALSVRLETGKSDPLEGVGNISRDTGGTRSYGNFGLNSQLGGSIFAFAKEHGKELGLTATPGTAAFDAQWRNAAGAMPVELHNAEMQWYSKNIASGVSERLIKSGVPEEIASDGRVQAYFADRSVQQGVGSINDVNKHSKRIRGAVDASGGDVATFLKMMSDADKEALESDFPSALRSGVYSAEGHNNRIDGRLNMALELDPASSASGPKGGDDAEYKGVYANLSPDQRQKMLGKLQVAQRETTFLELKNGAEALRRTGEYPVDKQGLSALDRAKDILTPNQYNKYESEWVKAKIEHEAVSGLDNMNENALQAHIDDLSKVQSNDPFYQAKSLALDKATKKAEAIRDLRRRDPVLSVANDREVLVADQGAKENPGDPESLQKAVKTRIEAQSRIGIPEGAQAPVTRREALNILAPTRGLEGKPLYEALGSIQEDLEGQYGPYARSVATFAIQQVVKNKDLAAEMSATIDKVWKGQAPKASDARRLDEALETTLAERAFQNTPGFEEGVDFSSEATPDYLRQSVPGPVQVRPSPPEGAIQYLRANPDMARDFDQKYGPGASTYFLR